MKVLRKSVAQLLPHNNARCKSPPGPLPTGAGKPVLVRSILRSGTHLLIDLLANNFPQLRAQTIYTDIGHCFDEGLQGDDIGQFGKSICKAHYPINSWSEDRDRWVTEFARGAFVLEPVRRTEDIRNSLDRFFKEGNIVGVDVDMELERYWKFWESVPTLPVSFEDLTSKEGCQQAVAKITEFIGEEPSSEFYPSRPKSESNKVLRDKLVTRLIGKRARRVNTTISFGG